MPLGVLRDRIYKRPLRFWKHKCVMAIYHHGSCKAIQHIHACHNANQAAAFYQFQELAGEVDRRRKALAKYFVEHLKMDPVDVRNDLTWKERTLAFLTSVVSGTRSGSEIYSAQCAEGYSNGYHFHKMLEAFVLLSRVTTAKVRSKVVSKGNMQKGLEQLLEPIPFDIGSLVDTIDRLGLVSAFDSKGKIVGPKAKYAFLQTVGQLFGIMKLYNKHYNFTTIRLTSLTGLHMSSWMNVTRSFLLQLTLSMAGR